MSFSSAISGLNAFSQAIDVTGNNIANSATTGYKSQSLIFAEKLSQNLSESGTANTNTGNGVNIIAKRTDFSQGAIDNSANTLDLAIRGDGFFRVQTTDGGTAYTRSGHFTVDKDDFITDLSGNYLTGYLPDANGNVVAGTTLPIKISREDIQPKSTNNVSIGTNLSANDKIITKPFDPQDTSTYNLTSSITIYDSLGVSHIARVYYRKTTETPTGNSWDVQMTIDEKPVGGGAGKVGTIEFDTQGHLKTGTPSSFNISQPISSGATSPINFTLDLSKTTQYASSGGISSSTQDGYGPGSLKRIDINDNGFITGTYDNDNRRILGQIVLSKFPNQQALNSTGNGLFFETAGSGLAITDKPGNRGFGSISSNAIEKSNVNVTQQLVDLITEQRGFQANVQTIKTEDQLQQAIIQIR